MHYKAQKRFGQNFLNDPAIIKQIIQALGLTHHPQLVEIGPGLGALTQPILDLKQTLTVIELDPGLLPSLQTRKKLANDRLHIIHQDALTVDYSKLGSQLTIFGNLPYNVGTAIIFRLFEYIKHIDSMVFMLQKEVVERISALPGSKAYGRMSVMAQYFCQVTSLFDVLPEAFDPKPKVTSAVVKLTPYQTKPHQDICSELLEKTVKLAFAAKRKTLANNFKAWLDAETFQAIDIDPKRRAETLTIDEFIKLSQVIAKRL